MKSKFYFFLAYILIQLYYYCRVLSIRLNTCVKICQARAIAYSDISTDDKLSLLNDMIDGSTNHT